ncbi:class I lanthipeptide [Kordia sp.]|uniref:class I lanthipeptide n=1 Tax=Kordia sp. TaxID=1965332 RepID=UPI003B5CC5F8
MKKNRLTTLNFAKQTISKLDAKEAKGLVGGATQSNNQMTGCHTNCTAGTSTRHF